MGTFLESLFGSAIAALAVLAIASLGIYVLRVWIGERIRQSVTHDFNVDLEEFKDDLSRLSTQLNSVQTAANAALVEGQRASAEWRMKAVDQLWSEVVRIRTELPVAVGFQDILLSRELNEPRVLRDLGEMADENMSEPVLHDNGVERVRPFVGESLYLKFFIYRAVTGRVAYLLEKGLKARRLAPWYEDAGVQQLLGYVLTKDEVRQLKKTDVEQLRWVHNTIEAKILEGMQRLIAGEVSSQESVEQAQTILKQVQSIQGTR